MGCDGGTIPTRDELVRTKKKPEQCLQYRTEHTQDVKKLEKLTNQLMRHMASKEK